MVSLQPFTSKELIGKGATGKVYATSDDKITKVVDMFHLQDLVGPFCMNHPNIIKVDSILITNNNEARVTMQQGKTCDYIISNFDEIGIDYIKQILAGLLYLHSNGIVHQDMKCQNTIKVGDLYKIIDFGAALLSNGNLVPTNVNGLYTAPEMNLQDKPFVIPGSDIYMFGYSLRFSFNQLVEYHISDHPLATYMSLHNVILGNKDAMIDYFKFNVKGLLEVIPYKFNNPDIDHLVGLMTMVNPEHRPTAGELLALPIFNTIPYKIDEKWYRRYQHQEPQYHSIVEITEQMLRRHRSQSTC